MKNSRLSMVCLAALAAGASSCVAGKVSSGTQKSDELGIDNYGVLKAGGKWPADGGHMNGRKWPILFAGLLLVP
jgi:hypothetical protein